MDSESSNSATPPGESPPTAFQRSDLAVRKYAAVLGYMQYESNTFWVRAQHFLVASALLAGLALPRLPTQLSELSPARVGILSVVSLAGLVLSWLWLKALASGKYWIAHWSSALQFLEKDAYEDLLLHRPFPPKPGYVRATQIADRTAWLFGALWSLSLLYCFACGVYYFAYCR